MTAETTTLLVRSKALQERAETMAVGKEALRLAARYQEAETRLSQVRHQVVAASGLTKALNESQIPLPTTGELANRMTKIRHALESAASSEGSEFESSVRDLERGVDRDLLALHTEISQAISAWRDGQPVIDTDFLEVLSGIEPAKADRAGRAVDGLHGLSAVEAAADIPPLVAAAQELQEAYTDLTASLPDVVQGFLEQVPTGVGLDLVGDEVLGWIREKGAESSFVVRLSR